MAVTSRSPGTPARTGSSKSKEIATARINYNNAAGQLGSPALTPTATTINFVVAPPFATINAPDYVKLVLDPPIGPTPNPSFEIVYLTAYTAGQTTGTIQRGLETTSGVAHNAGATWACSPTVYDLAGQPPVGACIPYAGSGDPPETNWVIADGRLIDRTVYADYFNRAGHAYNGGVDPGNNKVKIQDKRGKKSVGAINMGSAAGAGLNDNAHYQAVRGTSYGEVLHTLLAAESGQNGSAQMGNPGVSGNPTVAQDHSHTFNINTGPVSSDHSHNQPENSNGWVMCVNSVGGGWNLQYAAAGTNQATNHGGLSGVTANHSHNASGGTTGVSAWHQHAMTARNADSSHNNVDPCEADCYIVRIV